MNTIKDIHNMVDLLVDNCIFSRCNRTFSFNKRYLKLTHLWASNGFLKIPQPSQWVNVGLAIFLQGTHLSCD
jgi:hypothetical protein